MGWAASSLVVDWGWGTHRVGRVHIDGEDTCKDEGARVVAVVFRRHRQERIAGAASGTVDRPGVLPFP